jgi:hypothetical protein
MNDNPLSYFVETAKTTTGGVCSFAIGLIGGSIIADFQSYHTSETFWLCFVMWPLLIVYTIVHLWGLFLAPFLAIMFYGLIWKEWNRLLCSSLIAITSAITWLLCQEINPFSNIKDGLIFCISMGVPISLLLISVYMEKRRTRPTTRSCVSPLRDSRRS